MSLCSGTSTTSPFCLSLLGSLYCPRIVFFGAA
eukprot:COSAG06_NODE_220_length_19986_cov_94.824257_14_plen_32_part_01